jgi:transposase
MRAASPRCGQAHLRPHLVVGAQAVLRQAAHRPADSSPWLVRLLREKPCKVAAVALANKTARIVWAVLARNVVYRAAP